MVQFLKLVLGLFHYLTQDSILKFGVRNIWNMIKSLQMCQETNEIILWYLKHSILKFSARNMSIFNKWFNP